MTQVATFMPVVKVLVTYGVHRQKLPFHYDSIFFVGQHGGTSACAIVFLFHTAVWMHFQFNLVMIGLSAGGLGNGYSHLSEFVKFVSALRLLQ